MQPTAAFALAQFAHEIPAFETALDISGWQRTEQ
jgi:rsbT antagonist protein RsbS